MKKIKKNLLTVLTSAGLFFSSPIMAFAQETTGSINLKPTELGGVADLTFEGLITGGIRFIIVIAALIFFFVLVIGGIQWIMSGGDKAGAETARKRITAALVGLAIVFAAWAIGTLIKTLFGFDIFNLSFTPFF